MALTRAYTFDGGSEGAVVADEPGLTNKTIGTAVVYSASAAIHGNLGIKSGPAYGVLWFNVNPTFTFSTYVSRENTAPTSKVQFLSILDVNGSLLASFGYKKVAAGNLYIWAEPVVTDNAGPSVGGIAPGSYSRIDFQMTYNSGAGNAFIQAKMFYASTGNLEGTVADETLSATVPCAVPPALMKVNTYSSVVMYFDTIRVYDDASAWPGPYVASAPPLPSGPSFTVWNGVAEVPASLTTWDGAQEVPCTIGFV